MQLNTPPQQSLPHRSAVNRYTLILATSVRATDDLARGHGTELLGSKELAFVARAIGVAMLGRELPIADLQQLLRLFARASKSAYVAFAGGWSEMQRHLPGGVSKPTGAESKPATNRLNVSSSFPRGRSAPVMEHLPARRMLVNTELLTALRAGADPEKAGAASAVLADHERRLRRIELVFEIGRWGAIAGGLLLILTFILPVRFR